MKRDYSLLQAYFPLLVMMGYIVFVVASWKHWQTPRFISFQILDVFIIRNEVVDSFCKNHSWVCRCILQSECFDTLTIERKKCSPFQPFSSLLHFKLKYRCFDKVKYVIVFGNPETNGVVRRPHCYRSGCSSVARLPSYVIRLVTVVSCQDVVEKENPSIVFDIVSIKSAPSN